MIRILHLVSTISISSGVMSCIMNYYRYIDKNSIQFDFIYWVDDNDTYEDEIRNLGGEIYKIAKPGISKEYQKGINYFFQNNGSKYKALHLHEVYLNMFIAPLAKKNGIKHIISHSHTTMYSDKRISAIRNRILCIPLKLNSTHYFACSEAAGKFLYGKKIVQNERFKIINNAINLEKYEFDEILRNNMRESLGIKDELVIGHIGRFNKQKNHVFLIEIFNEVLKRGLKSKLMLVGEGPLIDEIYNEVKRLEIEDKVIFLGKRTDIPKLLNTMDIFVLPSIYEGLGIVLIEAQTNGLKCFTSDVVPKEAKITDQLTYISLKEEVSKWVDKILADTTRKEGYKSLHELRHTGFDIKQESQKLKQIYLNL